MFEGFAFTCDKLKEISYNRNRPFKNVNSNLFISPCFLPNDRRGRNFFCIAVIRGRSSLFRIPVVIPVQHRLIDISAGQPAILGGKLHRFLPVAPGFRHIMFHVLT
jgi:hypothetical protein